MGRRFVWASVLLFALLVPLRASAAFSCPELLQQITGLSLQKFSLTPVQEEARYELKYSLLPQYVGEERGASSALKSKVLYLSPSKRERYRVGVREGKLVDSRGRALGYSKRTLKGLEKLSGRRAETISRRYIFVMDAAGNVYAGEAQVGRFHHSSFLGGAPVAVAGEFFVRGGMLEAVSNLSGHYRSSDADLDLVLSELARRGLDVKDVKKLSR